MREIKSLTSLRMFAALLVFFCHFQCFDGCYGVYPLKSDSLWKSIVIEGGIGVTIFFVLSGFLITLRYYNDFIDHQISFFDYVRKRIARIWPLYYFILILTLLLSAAFGQSLLRSSTVVSLTLTQSLFDDLKYANIPTAWTLTVEEGFYLLAPLMFLSLIKAKNKNLGMWSNLARAGIVLALWVGVTLLIGQALHAFSVASGLANSNGFLATSQSTIIYTIFGRLFDFVVGIAAALLYLSGSVQNWWRGRYGTLLATSITLLAMGCMAIAMHLMNQAGGMDMAWEYNVPIVICSALIILSLTHEQNPIARFMGLRSLVYLGRVSYAVYLIQMTPMFLTLAAFFTGNPLSMIWLYLLVNIVSAILYEIVEKPAQKAILRFSEHLRPKRNVVRKIG